MVLLPPRRARAVDAERARRVRLRQTQLDHRLLHEPGVVGGRQAPALGQQRLGARQPVVRRVHLARAAHALGRAHQRRHLSAQRARRREGRRPRLRGGARDGERERARGGAADPLHAFPRLGGIARVRGPAARPAIGDVLHDAREPQRVLVFFDDVSLRIRPARARRPHNLLELRRRLQRLQQRAPRERRRGGRRRPPLAEPRAHRGDARDDGVFEPPRHEDDGELDAQLRRDGIPPPRGRRLRDVRQNRVEAPVQRFETLLFGKRVFFRIFRFESSLDVAARERARRETQRVPPRRRAGDGALAVAGVGLGAQALDGPRRGNSLRDVERELVPVPEPLRTPSALAEPQPTRPKRPRRRVERRGLGSLGDFVGVLAQERVVYVARARRVALNLRGERRARPRSARLGCLEPVERARQAKPRGDVVPRRAVQRGERVPHGAARAVFFRFGGAFFFFFP